MIRDVLLSFGTFAAATAVAMTAFITARQPRVAQNWWLLLGTAISAIAVILDSCAGSAKTPLDTAWFHTAALLTRALLPGAWLAFSVTFARAPGRAYRRRTIAAIALAFLVPLAIGTTFARQLVAEVRSDESAGTWILLHSTARALHVVVLSGLVVAMMRVEATFRASIGTTRWRLKFVMLGIGVLLGTLIYTRTQNVLFSHQPVHRSAVDAIGLFLAAVFFGLAARRDGFARHDVISAKMSVGHSVTVFVVGGYLFIVGILAQAIVLLGTVADFQVQAFAVLLGIAGLAVLLLSDRVRQKLRYFLSRIFGRSAYDFRKVWIQFSRQLSSQHDAAGVCSTAARLIADTFHLLSARIWLRMPGSTHLRLGASTAPSRDEALAAEAGSELDADFSLQAGTFNLEKADGRLPEILRRCSPGHFHPGGDRLAVPLFDHDHPVGIIVLADRVNSAPYSQEELDLLECIAAQIAATLMNLRITQELVQAKELEAFQTMSAFFVHDLKNAVSTLNLMLQNLPVHFANPEFRQDALRGIAKTADRVNHLIARLSALRGKVELRRVPSDLNQIIRRALSENEPLGNATIRQELTTPAEILADPEHLHSVISNLLLNARDAVSERANGEVLIATTLKEDKIELTIADNGVGMTEEFLQGSLFRPFSSTKAKGLGIGMFQCKAIIESHQGRIVVESEPGKGARIRVTLPRLFTQSPPI